MKWEQTSRWHWRIGSLVAPAFGLLVVFAGAGANCSRSEESGGARRAVRPQKPLGRDARIIFLHHSTGECIWNGGVPARLRDYNAANGAAYTITERNFPAETYGWENYPYDYWNIWVKHAGPKPFKGEPTLEILTLKYNVIVFKHCFPVSAVEADSGRADVASSEKRIENYKLQYAALKKKLRKFPQVRFLLWTGAVQVKSDMDEATATRARMFFNWVRNEWDQKGDNIFLWDFYELQTQGGLYLKPAYASGAGDSHPNEKFSRSVAPLLCRRIVDVIRGRGDIGSRTGRAGKGEAAPRPATKPAPATQTTAPAAGVAPQRPATRPGAKWVFDNAEDKTLLKRLWGPATAYAEEGGGHAISILFAKGEKQDWGEYGEHRLVRTRPPGRNYDLTPYRYLAFRMKADRDIQVALALVTMPKPQVKLGEPYFSFSAYLRPKAGRWATVALDLTKLELAVEGQAAYDKAGKPSRPMHLTALQFATHAKNEKADFRIDDVTFYGDLPKALRPHLQAP